MPLVKSKVKAKPKFSRGKIIKKLVPKGSKKVKAELVRRNQTLRGEGILEDVGHFVSKKAKKLAKKAKKAAKAIEKEAVITVTNPKREARRVKRAAKKGVRAVKKEATRFVKDPVGELKRTKVISTATGIAGLFNPAFRPVATVARISGFGCGCERRGLSGGSFVPNSGYVPPPPPNSLQDSMYSVPEPYATRSVRKENFM